jgi:hypothetical protein
MLRKFLYDEYYPEFGHMEKHRRFQHIDHCVDSLRQVLMCHGDVVLEVTTCESPLRSQLLMMGQTFDWIDGDKRPWGNFRIDHTCEHFPVSGLYPALTVYLQVETGMRFKNGQTDITFLA